MCKPGESAILYKTTERGEGVRIIAGEARGRGLIAPKGMDTRPTLDRVRESLFSILMLRIPDAVVLDLFAGSGALGLEALSRGAARAVFADHARSAQEAVSQNLQALGFAPRGALLRCDWRTAVGRLSAEGTRFDLIFLDPPYRMPDAAAMLEMIRTSALLAEDGLIVYEHAQDTPPDNASWHIADQRRYGDTAITFLTYPS